jgi:hypothetical protein
MSKGNFGEVGAHPKIRTTGWRTAPEGRPPSWCWVAARFSERRLEQEMAKAMPVVASDALSGYRARHIRSDKQGCRELDEAIEARRRDLRLDPKNYFARVFLQESLR